MVVEEPNSKDVDDDTVVGGEAHNHNDKDTTTNTTQSNPKRNRMIMITVLQVYISELYDILGMIRALEYDLKLYNASIALMLQLQEVQNDELTKTKEEIQGTNHNNNTTIDLQNRIRYQQYRLLQQIQQCCPRNTHHSATNRHSTTSTSHTPSIIMTIDGLTELLYLLEHDYYIDSIQLARTNIQQHSEITFDHGHMMEYGRPGTILIDTGIITGTSSSSSHTPMAVRCRSNRYRRTKTISGRVVSTHETSVEFVFALGVPNTSHSSSSSSSNSSSGAPQIPQYAIVETIWVQSEFEHIRNVQYNRHNPNGMLLLPTPTILQELQQRGNLYQSYCYNQNNNNSGIYVNYQPGTFHPCHGTIRSSSSGTSTANMPHQPSRVGGRMMIDIYQSYVRGIHICKPPADGLGTDIILPTFQSYARYLRRPIATTSTPETTTTTSSTNGPDDILVLYGSNIIDEMIYMTWPVLCGFSFVTRNWGVVHVDGITPITFHDTIFDHSLVLSTTRKRLLRAIVTCHGNRTTTTTTTTTTVSQQNHHTVKNNHNTASADVLPGKGEGLIILLYGPPGVGKTLTAEAVAELLCRPLYRVSMGELGTTPEHLEERLQNIFDICIPWQALVLIDEAELLLQTRTSHEIVRNAMVCVMLRLLEYYPGILFLTTNNGMDQLDPAIASRITVALEYNALDMASRIEIWRTSLSRVLNRHAKVGGGEDTAGSDLLSDDNLTTLSTQYDTLNGRQIKNAVQLASIVCQYENEPLTLKSIQDVLEMTVSTSLSASK